MPLIDPNDPGPAHPIRDAVTIVILITLAYAFTILWFAL